MADEVDRATDLIESRMAQALAARIDKSSQPSRAVCLCGEPIPAARQALGGVEQCVECKKDNEQRARFFR